MIVVTMSRLSKRMKDYERLSYHGDERWSHIMIHNLSHGIITKWLMLPMDDIKNLSHYLLINRRKLRSQTSDSMDRWKSRGGKSQRREEKRREEKRREEKRREEKRREEKRREEKRREEKRREEKRREEKRREEERRSEKRKNQKKEDAGARKGRNGETRFFQWFVALAGRKIGSLKRRLQSQLARWEMKNCTPLWREAHFEVKIHKAPQHRSTFRYF